MMGHTLKFYSKVFLYDGKELLFELSCTWTSLIKKILGRMANSADPDQTVPFGPSDMGLSCLLWHVCPSG